MLAFSMIVLAALVASRPITKREVPQEHSHEKYLVAVRTLLQINNPLQIQDPVFSLLGDAAAQVGAGKVTNLACLQQNVADQAFTNAKAKKDVVGMTNALVFRAVERNTGAVGQTSELCSETAVNPEVAAITQHQDPASNGAAASNKAITLELAKQIGSIGGNITQALDSGTFAPGQLDDATGAGNTCDDTDDPQGCIFTKNLIVFDATQAEIEAAAGTVANGAANNNNNNNNKAAAAKTGKVKNNGAAAASNNNAAATANTTGNLQTFTGSLGGVAAPVVTANGAEFAVQGNASFKEQVNAVVRSCDVQNNQCSNAANASGNQGI